MPFLSRCENSRRGSAYEQQMKRMAEKPRKEAMSLRSEQEVGPRRGSDRPPSAYAIDRPRKVAKASGTP